MKIAQYKSLEHGHITSNIGCGSDWMEREGSGYIRLTEFADVDFVPLPKEDVVPKQVAALENAKTEARAKFQAAINQIDEQISKLLAIEDHSNE